MQIEVLPPDNNLTPASQPAPKLGWRHVPAMFGLVGLVAAVGIGVLLLAALAFVCERYLKPMPYVVGAA